MKYWTNWLGIVSVLVLGAATGCVAPTDASEANEEALQDTEQPLYAIPSVHWFTENGWQVPVCFKTAGFQDIKDRVKTAIDNTWYLHTWLAFTGYGDCLGTAPANAVTIELHQNTGTGCNGVTNPGMGARFVGSDSQMSLTFGPNSPCIELMAAHEMGHALALNHEHQRPDRDANADACAQLLLDRLGSGVQVTPFSGGTFETAYDPDSVMNYCRDYNRNGTIDLLEVGQFRPYFLSKLDLAGARLMYGFWEEDDAMSAAFALTQATSFSGTVDLNDDHSWNSFGAIANKATRTSTGVYRIDFPRLAGARANIQVSAFNSGNRCKVDGFAESGSTLQVTVRCHNSSGSLANTRFSTSVVHGLGSFGANVANLTWKFGGYLLADQPATASYNANAAFSYNSVGLTNSIQRTGTGAYKVTFPGLDLTEAPYSYELTAVGSDSTYCNIRGHSDNVTETDRYVDVRCYSSGGTPTDSKFFLKYAMSTHQTPSFATVFAGQPSTAQYTADFAQSNLDNNCNRGPLTDPITITRTGTGKYKITLPQQLITEALDTPHGKAMASAIALNAPSTEYCNIDAFNASTSTAPGSVSVTCRRSGGSLTDTTFYFTFASLNATNCAL